MHSHSLISAFVILVLESTISKLATHEISVFQLVSVAEEAGFSLALSETPKSGFVAARPKCHNIRPNKKKIPVFRITRPYLNLLLKPRIFFSVSGKTFNFMLFERRKAFQKA